MENFETLNKNTKKAQNLIQNYYDSAICQLWQAYQRPSTTKQQIFDKWRQVFDTLNGYNFKIATFNKNVFTLAFYTTENNKKYIYYITPNHNYKIKID